MPTSSEFLGFPDGYAVGEGGAVTQITTRTTGVTLNQLNGQITTVAATLAAATGVSFTLTNSKIAATDLIVCTVISGAAVVGAYFVQAVAGTGTAVFTLYNHSVTISASEALVVAFSIIKGSIT